MHRVIGVHDLAETPFGTEQALAMFRDMIRARTFDDRALALQRQGWMSGYPPFRGQEASQVGAAHAMADEDWLFPTYRSNAMQIARGVPMSDLLLFRRGRAEFHSDPDVRNFTQTVPIATNVPHAVGAAMAADYRGDDLTVVCYFGDGATSEGDFHEGLNFAGVFDAPVVFLCENNGWAISTPRERQTRSASIAGKAEAYGFMGGQVDGNDPLAVREMLGSALADARNGKPVLVESLTYRQGPHSTSDDPERYRDEASFPDWRTRDPIDRFEEYLRDQDAIDDGFVERVREGARAEVEDAIDTAEGVPEPSPSEVFAHAYAESTPRLERQHRHLMGFLDESGLERGRASPPTGDPTTTER